MLENINTVVFVVGMQIYFQKLIKNNGTYWNNKETGEIMSNAKMLSLLKSGNIPFELY